MTGRRTALTAGAAGLSVLAWVAWLAWDREYQFDPETSTTSGPYETWQVVGCLLTLLAAAVLAGWVQRPLVAALAVTVPFTLCWTVDAALQDETGLFLVGALLIAVGLFLGSLLVAVGVGRATGRSRLDA
ncbi:MULTISPECIES: hypothetical protein [unclassified Modestobacter]|uniref:hypothetical protein n=1 Tax=unclassified Modestobacter TaxID=2643866 RepID=UPI0022AB3A35|nr:MULTISPECIES: hypothetical protein [unclassified Modestobacter]MCZ2823187.1 hypothetical protein [Modestobacter sp. VKM Ac-2981]MCZ2851433.1 hypothetical protein [Modestobacter sp. VKM Ac-2982]